MPVASLSSLLVPPALFFALGFVGRLLRSDVKLPEEITKALSLYLVVGIGLHGGAELAHAGVLGSLGAVGAALALGTVLPLVAYALLRVVYRVDGLNASAIAAHYGSVSAGTFVAAIAYLKALDLDYERQTTIMLAVMEAPGIIVALVLAHRARQSGGPEATTAEGLGTLMLRTLTHGSVFLLLGSIAIGAAVPAAKLEAVLPFFHTIFLGALCLFLLQMGFEAAKRLDDFRTVGYALLGFGALWPLLGGTVGLLVAHYALGFGPGGAALVAVLGASASYIAAPPAMRLGVPEANPSLYLTLSLGVTFPVNIVLGIPLFTYAALRLAGG